MTIHNLFGEEDHAASTDALFEQFWRTYPRRVGKGAARVSFEKALRRTTFPVLIAAVERFAAYPESVPGKRDSIPHPTTWLNQERWNDAPVRPSTFTPGARIPTPRTTCGECDAGFIFLDDGSVKRCPCQT